MADRGNIAMVTMVRDDDFFLERWIKYYGDMFGKGSLYVINHGDQESVRDIASGCNLFPVTEGDRLKFTMLCWRTKNGLLKALRSWYDVVIVCDVDEFIVVDPDTGYDLRGWLEANPKKTVRTPLGMELIHYPEKEPDSIMEGPILGPRRFATVNLWYAKPCIVSRDIHLSRGGHYCTYKKLDMPDPLYLFHLKYCDFDLYVDTLNRRQEVVAKMDIQDHRKVVTNVQWFAKDRDDAATFRKFTDRRLREDFDFSGLRAGLRKTYEPRNHDLYHFKYPKTPDLFQVPERFHGIF